jgi:hypothetical protein
VAVYYHEYAGLFLLSCPPVKRKSPHKLTVKKSAFCDIFQEKLYTLLTSVVGYWLAPN